MNKESLLKRRSKVETRFNQQNENKSIAEQEAYRLQGEYRLLSELIKEAEDERIEPALLKDETEGEES